MNFTIFLVDSCLLSKMTIQKKLNGELKIIASYPALRECLEKAKDFFVDIVLFNSDFDRLQDFEFCRALKCKFPKSKLIVSFKAMDKSKFLTLMSYGADGFVSKDSSLNTFKKVAQTVINGDFWAGCEITGNNSKEIVKIEDKHANMDKEKIFAKNKLTARELEVLKLLAQGKTNTQIAHEMIVSTNTAKAHVGKILSKLSVKDRVQAAVKAVRAHML